MKRRPAAILFVSAFLGAFCGFIQPSWPWWTASFCAMVLALLCVRITIIPICCVILFTLFITATHAALIKNDYLSIVNSLPVNEAIFDGTVTESYKKEDGTLRLKVAIFSLDQNVRLLVTIAEPDKPIEPLQQIRFKGKILPFLDPPSPVHFDAERFGLVHSIHGSVVIKDRTALWVHESSALSYWAKTRQDFRKRILSLLTPKEASLLLALIMGDTTLLSDEQRQTFSSIGAQHLLAVSGLQVATLAGLCFLLLIPLCGLFFPGHYAYQARVVAVVLTFLLTFWFVGLAGFFSSAIRAALMMCFMLSATFWARTIDAFDAFFVSGLITIVFLPSSVLDAGFLLSYAAVFGLFCAHAHKKTIIDNVFFKRSVLLSSAAMLFISSTAAFFFTFPIVVLLFGTFAPFSIAANVALLPLASIVQIPAIVLGLMGCIFAQNFLVVIASWFANVIAIVAEGLSHGLGKVIFVSPTTGWLWIGFSLSLLFIKMHQKLLACMPVCGALVWVLFSLLSKNDDLVVTVLPVGQGDATLFSLPSGQQILMDAGGELHSSFDPGEHIVVPSLMRKGIFALDLLIISHPDPDHILGAFALLDRLVVREIWHSGFAKDHPLTKRLIKKAHEKNIPIKESKEILGSHTFGKTEIQILAPNTLGGEQYFSELSANDNSIVMRILHKEHALLWPGDIEYFGEKLLLSLGNDLTADILKAPHHGSKTSSSNAFIEAVKPRHVIYSTGYNNRFNFPHEEVKAKYQKVGALAFNTALDGEITITLAHHKISIESYRYPLKKNLYGYHRNQKS